MNLIYITGSSSGIGKALAEVLLKTNEWRVIGLSRTCTIEHENYKHVSIDLGTASGSKQFNFQQDGDFYKTVLFNNAGTLGDIKKIGNVDDQSIETLFTLNVISPIKLCNKFIAKAYPNSIIINVSSGAGKTPISGWANYCASKAALDLFTQTVSLELSESNVSTRIFSIAPGVVDTAMQGEIRKSNAADFSNVEYFKGLKANKELADPVEIAFKFKKVIDSPEKFDTLLSLRNID